MVDRNPSDHGGFTLAKGVRQSYAEGQTDYSLDPLVLCDSDNRPIGRIRDGDGIVFCCRRGEREIQLTEAFTDPTFQPFSRPDLDDLTFVILTMYHEKFKDLPIAFAPTKIDETLADCVSKAGLHQLHTSESEKFAHVTFFFNGGNNQAFDGEEDIRIPSPKGIPFDQIPELSLKQVADQVITGIDKGFDLIVTNFANGDVIGHTSNNSAKVQCAEVVDNHLGRVVRCAVEHEYVTIITADHGNLEVMMNADGSPHVAHTTNQVECILVDPRSNYSLEEGDGKLADIAPSILQIMGLPQPSAMNGHSLTISSSKLNPRKVLLIILDGWGIGNEDDSNPIFLANTPEWDDLLNRYPHTRLFASGEAVGLQPGKAGNSEAGHLNIGAGRIVLQDDVRLDQAMKDGSFYANEVFIRLMEQTKKRNSSLHLIGLLTEKSSHGSIDYPVALLKMAKEYGLKKVYLHMILDGRSTEPGSAPLLLEKLDRIVHEIGVGMIVTGIGRGIALDRDGNYEKTKIAFDSFVFGYGKKCKML